MSKMTLMDRLARANKTLGRRQPTTPYGRIAAAQRWNSLADIGSQRLARLGKLSERLDRTGERAASDYADALYDLEDMGFVGSVGQRADNPFLSDDMDRYVEQSEFLDWCRYNHARPTPQTLKQFRWETYRSMPMTRREQIFDRLESGAGYPVEMSVYRDEYEFPDYFEPGWLE